MPDAVESHLPAEPATVDQTAEQRPRKPRARKVTKRPAPKASKPGAGGASTVHVKVGGGHTIAMPKGLAAELTGKDKKRLVALFKRVARRQKKRAMKMRAAKKR